jgi:prepilin-type N-terminal cleavage/methylation domain-containing protein
MTRAPSPRAGFTLVELLVALALLAVVLGAVVSLAVAQQRTYAALAARRAARTQLGDAALVLAHDLRPLVPPSGGDPGDVRELSDTLLDVVATTGGSVACAVSAPAEIELPPAEPADAALTWWVAAPREGDVALVLDPGPDPGEGDDRWLALGVAAAGASVAACAGSPLAGETLGGWRLTLAGDPLPPTVARGAPVLLARRRRWSHYRGSDGLWYLGLREWDGGGWGETQPVAGPFRRAGGAAAGMTTALVDSSGVRLAFRADPGVAWARRGFPVRPESVHVLVAARGLARGLP